MKITEHEFNLYKTQNPNSILGPLSSFIFYAVAFTIIITLIILGISLIPILIIGFIILLFYWGLLDWLYLKITGKERPLSRSKKADPFANLPISVEFNYLTATEEYDLIEKYKIEDEEEIYEGYIGKIITDPLIPDIESRYFRHKPMVYKDNIFVEEFKFPSLNTNIGFIDTRNLTYNIIKEFDTSHLISFVIKSEILYITWSDYNGTGTISVE